MWPSTGYSASGRCCAAWTASPKSTLTRQLRELEADGFLHREVYPEVPPRVEYTLTAMGESFLPVLNHMLLWSETHLCPPDYVNPYQDVGRAPLPGTEA